MVYFRTINAWVGLALLLALSSCEKFLPPDPGGENVLEGPLDGLTPSQNNQFLKGDALFSKIYTPQEGLGPIFIQNSCVGCHTVGGKGIPANLVTRFAFKNGNNYDYLLEEGGPQHQTNAISNYSTELIPEKANVFTKRLPPAVTGFGYIAAIHDSLILSWEDSSDTNSDGISGRASYVIPRNNFTPQLIHIERDGKYLARFGKKASKIRLIDQVAFALKEDIGITNDFEPYDLYNYKTGVQSVDAIADPEVTSAVLQNLVFYLRTLKSPPRRNENDPDVLAGEQLFSAIGCISCHRPSFKTAKSDIEQLSEKEFAPYSDFLLHDMGAGLDDGFTEGAATSFEWRTAPLWGIGLASSSQGGKKYFLHDGRASSIEEAVSYHG
ncbi:MAG: hypothetical protein A3H98_14055, partial [Bacteroidetes bacterium RIFCSPLOWO2_02_FULL_36_8]